MTLDARLKMPAVILTALVVNILMFTAIEYMVGLKRIRLSDVTDIDIANFIRVNEESRDVRSRRDPKAPQITLYANSPTSSCTIPKRLLSRRRPPRPRWSSSRWCASPMLATRAR